MVFFVFQPEPPDTQKLVCILWMKSIEIWNENRYLMFLRLRSSAPRGNTFSCRHLGLDFLKAKYGYCNSQKLHETETCNYHCLARLWSFRRLKESRRAPFTWSGTYKVGPYQAFLLSCNAATTSTMDPRDPRAVAWQRAVTASFMGRLPVIDEAQWWPTRAHRGGSHGAGHPRWVEEQRFKPLYICRSQWHGQSSWVQEAEATTIQWFNFTSAWRKHVSLAAFCTL